MGTTIAGDISVAEAWEVLCKSESATLVDVRTKEEWDALGVPDLSSVNKEAVQLSLFLAPDYSLNANFFNDFEKLGLDKDQEIFFLCKAGGRSKAAAEEVTKLGYNNCYNLYEGFEGQPDQNGELCNLSGWKAAKLPITGGSNE